MAWHERDACGVYFICFRLGKKRFKRTLQTDEKKKADSLVARVEDNLRDVERGRLVIPENADPVTFLLSDGRVSAPVEISKQRTLKELFDAYFKAIPSGSLEDSTISGMKIHRNHLEKHLRPSFHIRTLSLEQLQGFVVSRSQDNGTKGKLSAATIKKEIVTLRTVWNWGLQSKLVETPFPSRGLKYPKTTEKPPFMPFSEVEELTKGMKEEKAAELWESVYLPVEDIKALLKHVEDGGLPFVYPHRWTTRDRRSVSLSSQFDVPLRHGHSGRVARVERTPSSARRSGARRQSPQTN